ncbi:MAG TPA: stage II sporulation protein R [Clostridiaceae bacterium]|nr:stage II sporulation protein R [Clostridiaceae bacterium]
MFKTCLAILLIAIIMLTAASISFSNSVNKVLSDNLIRLHVIANSDSEEDQALKRDVRDAVIDFMQKRLENVTDLEQAKTIINDDIVQIEKIASEKVREYGKTYPVKAVLGKYPFPTKVYGDIALPAGNYQALRIIIGEGTGSNWWCVLFPPLCFVDVTHGTIPDSVKEDLKNSLTPEEYAIITSAENDGEIPVKVKFKIVEILQGSKIKFSGLISRIFGPQN